MMSISQRFSLSSMLYLFYNANLLKVCDDIKLRINVTEFVNDINILTYNESTKRNCQILRQIYDKYEKWAQQYNSKFAKSKHKLIHFSRTSKRYNMNVSLTLTNHEINAKTDVRVLNVQLNFKLRWRSHLKQIEAKLVTRQKTTQIIAKSTWESSMTISKRIYSTVSRSMISHETAAWYTSTKMKNHRKSIDTKLRSIQNRALRQTVEAYKATTTKTLQIKTNTISINIHLKKLIQRSMTNMNFRELKRIIDNAMKRIKRDVSSRRDRRSKLRVTLLQLKRR